MAVACHQGSDREALIKVQVSGQTSFITIDACRLMMDLDDCNRHVFILPKRSVVQRSRPDNRSLIQIGRHD